MIALWYIIDHGRAKHASMLSVDTCDASAA